MESINATDKSTNRRKTYTARFSAIGVYVFLFEEDLYERF
jgi:hypothetical protein